MTTHFSAVSATRSNPHTTRRGFLGQLSLLAAGAAAFPSSAFATPDTLAAALASAPAGGEDFWQAVRGQFAFRDTKVPMNAANLCPSPRVVAQRVTELTRDIDEDCSSNNREKFAGLLEASREKVARQLGVSADEIALVRNTSEANNTINNGLKLRPGDEIILWEQNHPTNNVAWDVRAARFGLSVRRISTPAQPAGPGQLVELFTSAFSPRTRVLALTHVSNTSGLRLPVRELCDAARRRGIYVHVDGAQTWGALDVNLPSLGCDSYAASAHKWFVGPKEVGLLYVRQDRIGEIWPNVVAPPGWGTKLEPDVRGARKFESLGQRDDAALAALADTADFHQAVGPARIERRVAELAGALLAGVKEEGLKLVTPLDPNLRAGVCIIAVPEDRRTQVFDRLYHEHGIAGSTAGGLRLCPHLYNTRTHVDRAVAGVASMRGLIG